MKYNIGINSLLKCALTLAVVLFFSFSAHGKTYRWRLGAGLPKGNQGGFALFGDWFSSELARRIKAETGDDVKWIYAWGGSIAKPGDELEALGEGLLTFAPIMYMYETSKLPLGVVFYQLPFSSPDMAMMNEIGYGLHHKISFMQKALEKHKVKYIGNMVWDSYQLLTTFPVRRIEDLKNRKIGGVGSNLEWIKAAGAIPVQAGLAEVYTSLQTGVFDGYLAAITWIDGFHFYEVAKYTALCDFGALPAVGLGMNLEAFNSLPKSLQRIILETGRELTQKISAGANPDLARSTRKLKDNGMQFYQLSYDQKKQWAEQMPAIPAGYVKKLKSYGLPAAAVAKYVMDAQKQAGYKFPRDWKLE